MRSPAGLNDALREYSEGLHAGGRNYTVRAEVIVVSASNATDPIDALVQAFDANTKVYGFESEDFEAMWATVKSCLEYAGDHGAFPSRAFLAGDRARRMLLALEQELRELTNGCIGIVSVGARHEYSDAGVFWDFTYVISMPSGSYVFVGASSD